MVIQIKCTCGREMQLVHAPESGVVLCSGCLAEVAVPKEPGRARPRTRTKSLPKDIWVTCRKCRSSYSRPARYAGRKTKCPVCAKGSRVSRRSVEASRVDQARPKSNKLKSLMVGVGIIFVPIWILIFMAVSAGANRDLTSSRTETKKRRSPSSTRHIRVPATASKRDPIPGYDPARMAFDASSLVSKIRSGRMTYADWNRWKAPIKSVSAVGGITLFYPKNRGTYILLFPCPDDKWHGKQGLTGEYPWVDYRGQGSRSYRDLPFMALCWSPQDRKSEIREVSRVPLLEARGKISLFANDFVIWDNRNRIRVKVVELERKPGGNPTH